MSVEREILITVLKLTRNGPIDYSLVSKKARIPAETGEKILNKLVATSLIKWRGKVLEASPSQRVKIAVQSIKLGSDFELVCRLLEWREFESISTKAFEAFNYYVERNFRFKGRNGKRWEIDLVACKKPLIVLVDCKQWKHKWKKNQIINAAEKHVVRAKAFTDILPSLYTKIKLDRWEYATVIPVVISLLSSSYKFHQNTPIVPVLQLRNFLNELPAHIESLTIFSQKMMRIDNEITEY